ncbi:MAG: DUF11 domain-containing protein [Ruminococcaceae bacterium]|nr:DUF11 domain-containing protein [Oscillospiraceae bacterium]
MAIFFNQATLSYNDTVTNSNIVTGEILDILSAAKTAVTETYTTGDTTTYVISIVNSGTTAATGVTVTDDLGAYTFGAAQVTPLDYVDGSVRYFVNGVLQPAPAVTAGPPLVISGLTVPAGGNVIVVYEATANTFAPLGDGASITNTAVITGTGITNPVTVQETITADSTARLTITKALSPETVTENGELTYTFTIQNYGSTPIVATDNATVTDTFNPILDPIAVTFNGAAWTEGVNYTYDEATGEFATIPSQITVPAATYTQDPTTGEWLVQPGSVVLRVTGTV